MPRCVLAIRKDSIVGKMCEHASNRWVQTMGVTAATPAQRHQWPKRRDVQISLLERKWRSVVTAGDGRAGKNGKCLGGMAANGRARVKRRDSSEWPHEKRPRRDGSARIQR